MQIRSSREIESELKEFWRIRELVFLAQFAINKQGKGYFRNIRKLNGDICFFPDNSRVNIPASNIDPLETEREYIINAFVAPEPKRKELGVEYLLYLDSRKKPPKINEQTPKQYVEKLYKQYQAAQGILKDSLSGAIKRLAVETNKKAETFIYEILQNADDYPDPIRKKVNIRFKIVGNYLVVVHNGQPFKENNVYAICSVATGDKERDINKTGYKGIGFKSIFKHSNFVWIHSGNFSFRFDENYHKAKGNETFWQLIPVWTEINDVDSVITTPDIINASVSIILKPKDGLRRLKEYADIFERIFKDERVLLFLRSIDSLSFQWNDKSFTKSRSRDLWEISDLPETEVPKELQDKINQIVDRNVDERVPEKFKDLERTKITFATSKKDGLPAATDHTRIYAYLPTDLNFGLPFLINGDFIPDGSREKLFWDLEWNQFLFKEAGYAFVQWLRELYLKYESGHLTSLLPNLTRLITEELDESKRQYIELFEEGFQKGVREIPFMCDTKGELRLLSDLTIDLTGLLEVMGEESFRKCTGIEEPFMHSSFASSTSVDELMCSYELGKEFAKENILDIISNGSFTIWLKSPSNNILFLKLLKEKGWLDEFSKWNIYLTEEGKLSDGELTYYGLGDDQNLLSWMNVPVLHPKVKNAFEPTELSTCIYAPILFIDSYILKNKTDIDAKLDDVENNIKFYQYLFKNRSKLSDGSFGNEQLGYFKVLGFNQEIINSISRESLYLLHGDLETLILKNALPANHIDLIDCSLFCQNTEVDSWKAFVKKFGVKEFTDSTVENFVRDVIVAKANDLFTHFRVSETDTEGVLLQRGNTHLWQFLNSAINHVSKTKEKSFREAVSDLPVYTKSGDELSALKECYLPQEYTGNETLEELVKQHPEIQITFVSDLYLADKSLSAEKWFTIFRSFHVKTDVKDVLIHYLLPGIGEYNEENLIAVTRLIFENRQFLKEKLSTLNLKLKTAQGTWLSAEKIIIGSYYSGDDLERQILPSIELTNTVSTEYSKKDLKNWYEFFKSLGAIEYESHEKLIAEKIKQLVETHELISKENEEFNFTLVKELIQLDRDGKLLESHCKTLKSMTLILKEGQGNRAIYEVAGKCHFPREYKPRLDLEKLLQENERPSFFISTNYLKAGDFKDVKRFLKKIGVHEDFYFVKSESKSRKEADAGYISFIDSNNARIKSNASSWSSQHKLKPWIELPYSNYLKVHSCSILFWEKVVSDEKFLKTAFEPFQYHYYFPSVSILSFTEWLIKHTPSIPARDGNCYKPQELYSRKLEKYIKNESLLSKIDLTGVLVGDKTLEEYLGLRMHLTLDLCLERINDLKDITKLKKEGIWGLFIRLIKENKLSQSETASFNEFKEAGFLPNQLGVWKKAKDLFFIQDDFDLGVGNSLHLIHDDLKPIASQLGVLGLTKSDFNPEFKGVKNEQFKDVLTSRIKYIALVESATQCETKTDELINTIKPISFESASRISFSYKETDPPIENTEKTFYPNNEIVYYVGSWRGARAAELFAFIHKLFQLKTVSLKILQDFLLLSDKDILDFLEEKNISYPDSWRPKQPATIDKSTYIENDAELPESNVREATETTYHEKSSELSTREIEELEALLDRKLSESEMGNTLIIALYRALKHYETRGYKVTIPRSSMDECIRKRMLEGVVRTSTQEVIKVLVRSAKKGILHLNYQAWVDLNDLNTELFVVTGNSSSDYQVFVDQKSLSSANKDSWVAKIGGDDKYAELSSLLNGEYLTPSKKFAPFQFLIRIKENAEYQSIFERIYNLEKTPDFSELD